MGPYLVLPLQARVDLGAMAIKKGLSIPQSFSITGASPSDCLMSYPGHSLSGGYSSAEVQSLYSTALADWAIRLFSVISRTLVGWVLPLCRDAVGVSLAPTDWAFLMKKELLGITKMVCWILWYINLCRLFNAKSIFMQIFSSISNNSV